MTAASRPATHARTPSCLDTTTTLSTPPDPRGGTARPPSTPGRKALRILAWASWTFRLVGAQGGAICPRGAVLRRHGDLRPAGAPVAGIGPSALGRCASEMVDRAAMGRPRVCF